MIHWWACTNDDHHTTFVSNNNLTFVFEVNDEYEVEDGTETPRAMRPFNVVFPPSPLAVRSTMRLVDDVSMALNDLWQVQECSVVNLWRRDRRKEWSWLMCRSRRRFALEGCLGSDIKMTQRRFLCSSVSSNTANGSVSVRHKLAVRRHQQVVLAWHLYIFWHALLYTIWSFILWSSSGIQQI